MDFFINHAFQFDWRMMECSFLSKEEAKKAFEKKQKKSQQQRLVSSTKSAVAVKSTKSATVRSTTSSSPNSPIKRSKQNPKVVLSRLESGRLKMKAPMMILMMTLWPIDS
ncbi:hypothetical protein FEM48_Zijuj07G0021400 [Ziziphus jujuba var. spinosa]|uniref:Uncharacterized protein n=1 Tax=Ziziphus jujuba var. spinosa TaxID=714518 RepID=A0A978V1U6_ZIZJJ|nr:hypothetical protein FEM48_Zijuj07G0021400 [Ziziphus jujuba var. spinosa]